MWLLYMSHDLTHEWSHDQCRTPLLGERRGIYEGVGLRRGINEGEGRGLDRDGKCSVSLNTSLQGKLNLEYYYLIKLGHTHREYSRVRPSTVDDI